MTGRRRARVGQWTAAPPVDVLAPYNCLRSMGLGDLAPIPRSEDARRFLSPFTDDQLIRRR